MVLLASRVRTADSHLLPLLAINDQQGRQLQHAVENLYERLKPRMSYCLTHATILCTYRASMEESQQVS